MKKIRKFLLLLSLFGLALTGCNSPKEEDYSNDPRYKIYQLAVKDGFDGDYLEWLASIRGKDGQDGHTPEIKIGDNGNWMIDGVDTGVKARGEDGKDGEQGPQGIPGQNGSNGQDGKDGKDGTDGQDGKNGEPGPQGIPGENGVNGQDGTSVLTGYGEPSPKLGKVGDSYIDLNNWNYYVKDAYLGWALRGNIKGDQGEQGPQGNPGSDGNDGEDGQNGNNGLSAYEIYIKYHPEYHGDETQWLDDLINGRLANKIVHTVSFDINEGYLLIPDQEVVDGGKIIEPADPTRYGYILDGWTYNGEPWSFNGYVVTCDMTLVAQWAKAIQVNYYDYDGHGLYSYWMKEGDEPSYPYELPTRETSDSKQYVFNGWELQPYSNQIAYFATYIEMMDGLTIDHGIVRMYHGESSHVVIPEYWDGYKVTQIGPQAFYNNKTIKTIELPNTLTTIGFQSFLGSSIESIIIPDSVTSIGQDAFERCNSLESMTVGTGVKTLSGAFGFEKCQSLVDLNLHTTMEGWFKIAKSLSFIETSTNVHLFLDGSDKELTTFIFPVGTEEIAATNLYCLSAITTVYIPWSVNTIDRDTFYFASNLKTIIIDSDNPNYSSKNGVLYDKLQNNLIAVPQSYVGSVYVPRGTGYPYSLLEGLKYVNAFTVDDDNPRFYSHNGVLYSKDRTKLLVCPGNCASPYFFTDVVTTIGSYAFQAYSSLTSLSLPSTVETLEQYAFALTVSLTEINIPANVRDIGYLCFYGPDSALRTINIVHNDERLHSPATFYGLPKDFNYNVYNDCDYVGTDSNDHFFLVKGHEDVKNLVVPDDCYYVGDEVFYGSQSLETVTLGNHVKCVGNDAFNGCINLRSVDLGTKVSYLLVRAFANCSSLESIVIPDNVISLDDCVFMNCTGLQSVTIGSGVTSLYRMFENCSSLESVTIPGTVQVVSFNAFAYCSNLQSVTIEEGVEIIAMQAFLNCSNLTHLSIPASIYTLDATSINGCNSLESVSISSDSEYFVFKNNAIYSKDETTLCALLRSFSGVYVIPNSVTTIKYEAFSNCSHLEGIVMPKSVTKNEGSIVNVSALKGIFYLGNQEEFALISGNSNISKRTYFYSETEPESEGRYWHYVDDVPTIWE